MLLLLAGGTGTRMGGGKPFVEVDGLPLWRWMADGLTAAGAEVTVAVGPEPFDTSPYPLVTDPAPDLGPLGGIAAVAGTDLVVWTVDVPDWTREELTVLTDAEPDAVHYLVDGDRRPQPLLARWPASITAVVPDYLAQGRRAVRGLLDGFPHGPIGAPRARAHLTTATDLDGWLASR